MSRNINLTFLIFQMNKIYHKRSIHNAEFSKYIWVIDKAWDCWILAKFFFARLRTETESRSITRKKRSRSIFSHVDRKSLVNKGFIVCLSGKFFSRNTAGGPERAGQLRSGSQSQRSIWFILPTHGAIPQKLHTWCCKLVKWYGTPNLPIFTMTCHISQSFYKKIYNGCPSLRTNFTYHLLDLNLSKMPPDLDYLLVKTLDMRRRGERRYGWQKVGAAFKIPKDDLEYLNIEYRRDNGSPTSTLLAILGTRGKTVSDLENVLRSPKVKLPNVASLIRRYIREANKFQ